MSVFDADVTCQYREEEVSPVLTSIRLDLAEAGIVPQTELVPSRGDDLRHRGVHWKTQGAVRVVRTVHLENVCHKNKHQSWLSYSVYTSLARLEMFPMVSSERFTRENLLRRSHAYAQHKIIG